MPHNTGIPSHIRDTWDRTYATCRARRENGRKFSWDLVKWGVCCSQDDPPKPGRAYAAMANSTNCLLSFAVTVVARYVGAIPEFSVSLARQSILVRPHQEHISQGYFTFNYVATCGCAHGGGAGYRPPVLNVFGQHHRTQTRYRAVYFFQMK